MSNSGNSYYKLLLLMMRVKRRIARLSEQQGLTPAQGMLLVMFEPTKGKSMNDLSCRMGCDASNVTGLVDRIDSQGLIERTVDPADRRVKMIALSKKGQQARTEILDGLAAAEAVDLQRLTSEEQTQFMNIIDKLTTR